MKNYNNLPFYFVITSVDLLYQIEKSKFSFHSQRNHEGYVQDKLPH